MKSSAGFIGIVIKLSARVKCGKDHAFRGDPLFVHPHRDSTAVILYRTGSVCLQRYGDLCTESRKMLVHRIVDDFIYQMV